MKKMKLRAAILLALAVPVCTGADFLKGNSFGKPSAPIMMEVFSDFQCPACKTLHDTELPLLMKEYVVPGKVYLIYRYYPLTMHAFARKAAEDVAAAAQLGHFEKASESAFARQAEWSVTGGIDEIISGGLAPAERAQWKALTKSPAVQQAIEHDLAEGNALPVPSTPTLLVTYRMKRYTIGGTEALKYEWVKAMLDDLLKK